MFIIIMILMIMVINNEVDGGGRTILFLSTYATDVSSNTTNITFILHSASTSVYTPFTSGTG